MNLSVEHLGACKKLLKIEVDVAGVDAALEKAASEFKRYAQLPGFRGGRAPKHLILKSFGSRIETEAKNQLIGQAYSDAVKQEKFRVIGEPIIEEIQFGRGQPLQFAATIETAPEFALPEYKGIEVKRETRVVTETDVDQAIEHLRHQRATYADVDRGVEDGDYVVVDYNGTSEGKPLTDFAPTARGLTEKKGFWIAVAKDSFIPGFTEALIGAKAGEKRSVQVDFPADFVSQPLAGRKGDYEVLVQQVKVKQLPPADDDFAKAFGAEDLLKLREGVENDLKNQAQYKQKQSVRDQMIQALLGRVDFELPDAVVLAETRTVVYDIVRENQERGITKEALDQQKDEIFSFANKSAKERVKGAFILGRIAEKEGITATDEEVTRRILFLSQQNGIKPERLVKQLQERNGIPELRQQIVNHKVLDYLEINAKIEEGLPTIPTAQS